MGFVGRKSTKEEKVRLGKKEKEMPVKHWEPATRHGGNRKVRQAK